MSMEVSGDVVGIDDLMGQHCDDYWYQHKVDPTIILPQQPQGLGICQTQAGRCQRFRAMPRLARLEAPAAVAKLTEATSGGEANHHAAFSKLEEGPIGAGDASTRRSMSDGCRQAAVSPSGVTARDKAGSSLEVRSAVLRTNAVQQGIFILARGHRLGASGG